MTVKKSSLKDAPERPRSAPAAPELEPKPAEGGNGSSQLAAGSQVAGRTIASHQLDESALFGPIDHGEMPRPDVQPEVEDSPELAEPVQLEEDCNPLSDMVVALAAIGARMMDEDNPLTDAERAELHDATAALERRYAPYLANAGDALLWGRMAITVGVVFQPRVSTMLEKRREKLERQAQDASRIAGKVRVGEDLGPGATVAAAHGPTL
jgi:hypothetical protein